MLLPSTNGAAPLAAGATRAPQPDIRTQASAMPAMPVTDPAAPAAANNNAHPAPDEVEKALKTLNEFTATTAQDVRFSMDEESGKTIIKVVDTATQQVLRQFPSADALSIVRSIDKMQGLLIREKA